MTEMKERKEAAKMFGLIHDPARVGIIEKLDVERRNVGDLAEDLGLSQPALSHHMAGLRAAGAVEATREGKHNYYVLTAIGHQLAIMVASVKKFIGAGSIADKTESRVRAATGDKPIVAAAKPSKGEKPMPKAKPKPASGGKGAKSK